MTLAILLVAVFSLFIGVQPVPPPHLLLMCRTFFQRRYW